MVDFGPTPTGFRRKTFAEIKADVVARIHATVSAALDFDSAESVIANIVLPILDELSQAWESAELSFNAFDPNGAVDFLVVAICQLSGISQLPARNGFVDVTLTVDDAVSFDAGQVVLQTTGNPLNTWENVDPITFTTAGTVAGFKFRSQAAGSSAVAGAGTLIVAQPLTHLVSATNPADALAGRDAETFEELELRRKQSLAAQGSATLAAIVSDVLAAVPTAQVGAAENTSDVFADGLPPHSFRITVYDPSATNDTIAQAIFDSKPAGIASIGSAVGAVVDPLNLVSALTFQRATETEIHVRLTAAGTYDQTAVKNAIIAAHPRGVGVRVTVAKLEGAAINVQGVDDITLFEISSDGFVWTTSNYNTTAVEVALLDPSRITFIP